MRGMKGQLHEVTHMVIHTVPWFIANEFWERIPTRT